LRSQCLATDFLHRPTANIIILVRLSVRTATRTLAQFGLIINYVNTTLHFQKVRLGPKFLSSTNRRNGRKSRRSIYHMNNSSLLQSEQNTVEEKKPRKIEEKFKRKWTRGKRRGWGSSGI